MQSSSITLIQGLKAALRGGLFAAGINLIWFFVLEYSLKLTGLPKGFVVAIFFSTLLPILFGSLVYVLLVRNFQKGKWLFLMLAIAFAIFSMFPSFQETLADGTPRPAHFVLLTVPMHVVATLSALFFLMKKPTEF